MIFSTKLKNNLKFDDYLDTFAVRGAGVAVGALLTGVFQGYDLISNPPAGKVLLEKGRLAIITSQFQDIFFAYLFQR